MTFFKLCKYDLKNGMFKEGIKYLACVVLFLGFCIGFIYTKGKDLGARTFGDFLFFITAGMEEYIPMPGNIFMFPALWMLMILAPLYITLYNVDNYNYLLLMRCVKINFECFKVAYFQDDSDAIGKYFLK